MITRSEVVSFYSSLAGRRNWPISHDVIARLPPATCRWLLFGNDNLPEDFDWADPKICAVGASDSTLQEVRGILLSTEGFADDIQHDLPLYGHSPLGSPGIVSWIILALEELEHYHRPSLDFIRDWLSMIVWVERDRTKPDITELTSTSIPSIPFATFVSKKMIRHLPPKHIMPAVNFYGIQENLFHEALHQQLSSLLVVKDLVRDSGALPEVHIPWRRTSWPIDRVLHAAWVYRGLGDIRLARINSRLDGEPFMMALEQAIADSVTVLEYLREALWTNRQAFTPDGMDVVNYISSRQEETLATIA